MTTVELSSDRQALGASFVVFRVIERVGERAEWRKVGSANARAGGSFLIHIGGARDGRIIEATPIDRAARPIPTSKDPRRFPTHDLSDANTGAERNRVGAAFLNRDGSFTLLIDEGEREGPKTRLQMRAARGRTRSH